MFKDIINSFLEFIYPENISCIICNLPINKSNTYSMCKECFSQLHFILDSCIKCGKPIVYNSLEKQDISSCSYCRSKDFYFDKAISCIEYTEFSKKIIFGLKYKNKTHNSKYISQIMKEKLEIESIKFDIITYVPLHKRRLKKRGFNQSQKIAKYLGINLNVPVRSVVHRVRHTEKLYKLRKNKRKEELKGAFLIANQNNISNKNILLIDDIFTTGSTVNEISKELKLKGANKVFILTFLTKYDKSYNIE